ncbi:MAG: restriction endonuclease, partial [Proteobacteria bacterium]|nr:restriction endonuclease [Pseudomonadota bacterium]
DFIVRQKVGGLHLTYAYVKQFPVLPPEYFDGRKLQFIIPRYLGLTYTSHSIASFAHDLGCHDPPFAWDEDRRALLRADLDAFYARAYGLDREELRYILNPADVMGDAYPSETFRVLMNGENDKFGEYRTRRLILAAWDRMEAKGEFAAMGM